MSPSLASIVAVASALLGVSNAFPDLSLPFTISYSTVPGYFLQDQNSTDPSTFDYTATNFGLINQTYASDAHLPSSQTQWQRFARQVSILNAQSSLTSPPGTFASYKVLFLGRHGEGFHNAAESYYGTPAWNCYWAELSGNGSATWSDAHLTANGLAQAQKAHAFWRHEISTQKIPTPQRFYSSPLWRCLSTANVTFAGFDAELVKNGGSPFVPTVKELLREGISIHTCDRRSDRAAIHQGFSGYLIEPGFAEKDPLWNGVTAETAAAQDVRSKKVLDQVFVESIGETYISVTSHSGEIASILRVLGHRPFGLSTGAVIPVLVKAEVKVLGAAGGASGTTTTVSWTPSPHCTSPPVTSAAGGCVCQGGVAPVTTTLVGSGPVESA